MNASSVPEKGVAEQEHSYHQDRPLVIYGAAIGLKSNNRLEVIQSLSAMIVGWLNKISFKRDFDGVMLEDNPSDYCSSFDLTLWDMPRT